MGGRRVVSRPPEFRINIYIESFDFCRLLDVFVLELSWHHLIPFTFLRLLICRSTHNCPMMYGNTYELGTNGCRTAVIRFRIFPLWGFSLEIPPDIRAVVSIRNYLFGFLLGMPPEIPSDNSSSNFFWRFLLKLLFWNPLRILSGNSSGGFLCGFLHGAFHKLPFGISPKIPSRDFFRDSLWWFLQEFPLEDSSRNSIWGFLCGFLLKLFMGNPPGVLSKEFPLWIPPG